MLNLFKSIFNDSNNSPHNKELDFLLFLQKEKILVVWVHNIYINK